MLQVITMMNNRNYETRVEGKGYSYSFYRNSFTHFIDEAMACFDEMNTDYDMYNLLKEYKRRYQNIDTSKYPLQLATALEKLKRANPLNLEKRVNQVKNAAIMCSSIQLHEGNLKSLKKGGYVYATR